ncbi:MAG: hypothetical protein ABF328_04590 [Akkermansiaceae bacterium]
MGPRRGLPHTRVPSADGSVFDGFGANVKILLQIPLAPVALVD